MAELELRDEVDGRLASTVRAQVPALDAQAAPTSSDDFPKVLAWTAIPAAVRTQWSASVQAHATPNFGPRYELRFLKVLPSAPIYRDVDAAHASLAKALDAIAAYAATQKLDGWASTFHAARRALDDDASQTASFGSSSVAPTSTRGRFDCSTRRGRRACSVEWGAGTTSLPKATTGP